MSSRDELLRYYQNELTFLRYMGQEFAEKYPRVAGRLQLEADRCEDPHVERLLEGFAFLAARVHMKVDDDFPEITQALLDCVYPHYLRPMPSCSVAQFHLNPGQALTSAVNVPRDSVLYSRSVQGAPCKFRTCFDTQVWPLSVTEAEWKTPDRLQPAYKSDALSVARVVVQLYPDVKLEKLNLGTLRFYLSGEDNVIHNLYEFLCNNCVEIVARDLTTKKQNIVALPPSELRPVGFAKEESLLPYTHRSFDGYRLLQEYFVFPQKFFFLELSGLHQLASAGFGQRFELLFFVSGFEGRERHQALELGVNVQTFRTGCSPIVNLFTKESEPIELDQTRSEYAVVPDLKHRNLIEVFSVDEVRCANPRTGITKFERFYGYRHSNSDESKTAFWYTMRRPAGIADDQRTEVFLNLVDKTGRTLHPNGGLRSAPDSVTVRCTCTNYRLPSELTFGNDKGDFQVEGAIPVERIVCLHKPTPTLRPPMGKDLLWRLVSQLSLNYLSLVENGREALQSILQLYNFSESLHLQKQISGIEQVEATRHYARLISENGVTSARGVRINLQLDEDQFVGGGAYLFASVLERFLGGYVTMNSFSQLVASTKQRKEVMREWPPRAGQLVLI